MKKIAMAGLIALGMIALSQQQASAWVNAKFGVGLNWQLQSANNNTLWGVYRNGQVPGPEAFGSHSSYGVPFGAVPYDAPPYAYAPMPQTYDAPPQQYAGQQYSSPYQFATYPRQVYYYYPTPSYYYGR
jgi:hypothetical protein